MFTRPDDGGVREDETDANEMEMKKSQGFQREELGL